MAEGIEGESREAVRTPLCLEVCPRCTAARYRGGVCHLERGHGGWHECNVVGGEQHRWR
jgi:hypothetical protein